MTSTRSRTGPTDDMSNAALYELLKKDVQTETNKIKEHFDKQLEDKFNELKEYVDVELNTMKESIDEYVESEVTRIIHRLEPLEEHSRQDELEKEERHEFEPETTIIAANVPAQVGEDLTRKMQQMIHQVF